jgi:PAS domain S-box-containing protein
MVFRAACDLTKAATFAVSSIWCRLTTADSIQWNNAVHRTVRHLRTALLLRLFLIGAVPLLLWAVITAIALYQRTMDAAQTANENRSRSIATAIDTHVAAIQASFVQAGGLLAAQPLSHVQKTAILGAMVNSFPDLEGAILVDDRGIVRQAALDPALQPRLNDIIGIDLARSLTLSPLPSSQPRWTAVERSPWTHRPFVAVELTVPAGRLVGVLSTKQLAEGSLDLPHQERAAILDPSGLLILNTLAWLPGGEASLRSLPAVQNAQFGQVSSEPKPITVEGVPYLLASAPARDSQWIIVRIVPAAEAYASARNLVNLVAATAACALLLLLLVASIVARRTLRPLSTLAVAAGNTDDPIPPQRHMEIEQLAQRYRQLFAMLQQHQQTIASFGQTLSLVASAEVGEDTASGFSPLIEVLAAATSASCVLIFERMGGPTPRARVIASKTSITLPPEFTYDLRGNPCADLKPGQIVHVASGVRHEYPDSPLLRLLGAEGYLGIPLCLSDGQIAGHIAILDERELPADRAIHALLQAVATRVSVELERRRMRQFLREAAESRAAAERDLTQMVRRSTADGTITYADNAYCRYHACEAGDLIGRSFLTLVREDDREAFRMHLSQLGPMRTTGTFECRALNGAGSMRLQQWTNRVILDAKGRVIEYQGTGQDITELRRIEDELSDLHEQFDLLARSMSGVFWVTDWITQKVTYVSPAFGRVFGIASGQLIGNSLAWTTVICEDDRPRVARRFLTAASEGSYRDEFELVAAGGSRRIRLNVNAMRGFDGSIGKVVALAECIGTAAGPVAPE